MVLIYHPLFWEVLPKLDVQTYQHNHFSIYCAVIKAIMEITWADLPFLFLVVSELRFLSLEFEYIFHKPKHSFWIVYARPWNTLLLFIYFYLLFDHFYVVKTFADTILVDILVSKEVNIQEIYFISGFLKKWSLILGTWNAIF